MTRLRQPARQPARNTWSLLLVDVTTHRKKQIAKARDKVRVCARARIVGVVFWDRPHNVTGRASYSIELHPIPDFACFC
jgi:hypothetical protein